MISPDSMARIDVLLAAVIHSSRMKLTYRRIDPTQPDAPCLTFLFSGPDTRILLARNAEYLLALEHVAAKALRLTPDEHDQISFDADGFKARRDRVIQKLARDAANQVRANGLPYHFEPMNSRERRLLHLALAPYGLPTQSEGEGPARHLVAHPAAPQAGVDPRTQE